MTGIILAGGKNSRIDYPKGLLTIGGKTVIEHTIDVISPFCTQLLVVTNQQELYQWLNVPMVSDVVYQAGPLGGIQAGLLEANDPYCLVVPCDMPFLSSALIGYMQEVCDGYDGVVPRWGGLFEPLCAIYGKSCLSMMSDCLEQGNYQLGNVISHLNIRWVQQKEMEQLGVTKKNFHNINTFNDFKQAITMLLV